MTHASLCKKTYKMALGFHATKSRRMDKMGSHGIAANPNLLRVSP
jgi:hypothetical protein